jgi:hypothetical protein
MRWWLFAWVGIAVALIEWRWHLLWCVGRMVKFLLVLHVHFLSA